MKQEVENMLVGEYDYEMDIAAQRRESFEQGIEQGIMKTIFSMKNKNCDNAFIADITGLSIEEIERL